MRRFRIRPTRIISGYRVWLVAIDHGLDGKFVPISPRPYATLADALDALAKHIKYAKYQRAN